MSIAYFKKNIGDDVLICQYDDETMASTLYRKSVLTAEKRAAEDRLAAIPTQPTNAQLLAWAKEHYPQMDYGPEIASLEAIIAKNAAILEAVK